MDPRLRGGDDWGRRVSDLEKKRLTEGVLIRGAALALIKVRGWDGWSHPRRRVSMVRLGRGFR